MKIISILISCAMLSLSGCATIQEHATPVNARIATALVCTNAIQYAVTLEDREKTAAYIYAVAHAIRTLSGGKVPTQLEVKQAIDVFTPDGGKWVTLATNISSIWGAFYPKVAGNPALALAYLENIAAGAEDSASAFMPKK